MENPYEHLVSFERLCDTFRTGGVPHDSIKLILFPFSLGERASQWERTLPSHLVKSWNDCKQLFLQQFYPIQRTTQVKRAILNFELGSHESFNDAWDRLKGYTKDCPHHGFEKGEILSIFYGGVTKDHKWTLDVASKGSFLKLNVDQGEFLVENLSRSFESYMEWNDENPLEESCQDSKVQIVQVGLNMREKLIRVQQLEACRVQENCQSKVDIEVESAAPDVSEDSDGQAGEDYFSTNQEKTEQITLELSIEELHRPADRSRGLSAAKPEISMEKRSSFTLPPYKPVLPFPGRKKKELIAKNQSLFDEGMGQLADASLEQLTEEDHLQTDVVKSGNVEHLHSKTLGFEKLVDTHQAVDGAEIIENLLGSKTEVVAAKEKNLTQALHANSTTTLDLLVESIDPAPDDWSELQALKQMSKWQDETVKELSARVRELTCLVKEMKGQTFWTEEIRMKEFRGWFYDEYDPGDRNPCYTPL